MNDIDLMSQNFDSQRLIIQRNIGFKDIIPGSGQWAVLTDKKEECWICNQSVMTIFLWKPRIGSLTALKDKTTVDYYKKAVIEGI